MSRVDVWRAVRVAADKPLGLASVSILAGLLLAAPSNAQIIQNGDFENRAPGPGSPIATASSVNPAGTCATGSGAARYAPTPWAKQATPDYHTEASVHFDINAVARTSLPGFSTSPNGGCFMGFRSLSAADNEGIFQTVTIPDANQRLQFSYEYTEYTAPGNARCTPRVEFRVNSNDDSNGTSVSLAPNVGQPGGPASEGDWVTLKTSAFVPADFGVSSGGTMDVYLGVVANGCAVTWAYVDLVNLVLANPIEAGTDTVTALAGATDVVNVLAGDTVNNVPANTSNSILSVAPTSSVPPELSFDPSDGSVDIAPGTPPGTYSFDYQLCEATNTTNCVTATVSVTVDPLFTLSLDKPAPSNADEDGSGSVTVGDTLTYTITATNTGNAPQTDVIVSDPLLAAPNNTITCPSVPAGGTCVLTGTHVVTPIEANAQSVDNTASVRSNEVSTTLTESRSTPVELVAGPTASIPTQDYVDWANATSGSVCSGTIPVTAFSGGTNGVTQNDSTFENGATANGALTQVFVPEVVADSVNISGRTGGSITFDQPVINPMIHFYQLDANTVTFTGLSGGQSVSLLTSNNGQTTTEGGGGLCQVALSGAALTGCQMNGVDQNTAPNSPRNPDAATGPGELEGAGTLLFTGTFSEITFTSNNNIGNDNTTRLAVSVDASSCVTSADLQTVKILATGSSSTPAVGDNVSFDITVTNNGPSDATNVTLTDNLPSGLTYASDNATVGSYDDTSGVWTIGSLANGASATLTLTGTVDASAAGTAVTNTTTAASTPDQDDPGTTGDDLSETINPVITNLPPFTCTANFYEVISGQLSVLDPATGVYTPIGTQQLTYNATGYNVNDNYVYGIGIGGSLGGHLIRVGSDGEIDDVADLALPSPRPVSGDMDRSNNLYFHDNNNPNILFFVNVTDPTIRGTINFAGTGRTTIDMVYLMSGGQEFLAGVAGRRIVFWNLTTQTVGEISDPDIPSGAHGAVWTDPSGNLYASNNNTGVITIIADPLSDPTIVGTLPAAVSSNHDGMSCPDAPAPFTLEADLQTVKTLSAASSATPAVGDTVSYEITVTNNGPDGATNVSLTDEIPSQFTFDSFNAPAGTTYDTNSGLWTIGSLANGASVTLILNATVPASAAGQQISNTTTIASTPDQPDPSATGDSPTQIVDVMNFIEAMAETFTATAPGGVTPESIFASDTLNGTSITPADVDLTVDEILGPDNNPSTDISVNVDGTVAIGSNAPAGDYTIEYTICEAGSTTICDTVIETVTVAASPGLDLAKVLTSNADEDGSGSVTAGDTLTYTITATNTGNAPQTDVVVSDPLLAAPNNTITCANVPAGGTCVLTGTHVVTTAEADAGTVDNTASVQSDEVTTPVEAMLSTPVDRSIDSVDDDFASAPIATNIGGSTASVFANDTLNGAAFVPADVTLSVQAVNNPSGSPSGQTFAINSDGEITVPAGTPAQTYVVVYEICDAADATNCDTAEATIVVSPPNIDAQDDDFTGMPVGGADGGVTPTVFSNDTLNTATVTTGDVEVSVLVVNDAANAPTTLTFTANPDGTIDIPSGTPAGDYRVIYEICETGMSSGPMRNCATATAEITVSAAPIDAVAESFGPVSGIDGGTTGSILTSDTLNGSPVDPADVDLTVDAIVGPDNNPTTAISVNPDGTVTVPAGTPAGDYEVTYTICETLNPSNCDSVTETITVSAAPIDAVDDTVASPVTLTETVADPAGALTLNPDGTVDVAPGTPAGTYTGSPEQPAWPMCSMAIC